MSDRYTRPSSLKQILNLDKAEAVFQKLLDAVEAHSSELAAVKKDVAGKAGSIEVCSMCQGLQNRLTALERRLAHTETAVVIPTGTIFTGHRVRSSVSRGHADPELRVHDGRLTSEVTVGEAVHANSQVLQAMMKRLDEKAGKDELLSKGEALEATVRERERAIRQWGVGSDFADSLARAQRGLAGQLAAVEGVLATKLDKSELDNMQATCAKVSTVSVFLDEASSRVSNLESGLDKESRERMGQAEATKAVLDGVLRDLAQKSDKVDSNALTQDVEHLRKDFIEETQSGRRQVRTLRQSSDGIKKALEALTESNGKRLRDVEACLEGAATKEEMALKADARYTDTALSALRADCALRARQSDFAALDKAFASLETEHAKTRRATDLAGRFVDWFSSRGEAYEHNLDAVEKHIENLSTRSVRARARPVAPDHRLNAAHTTFRLGRENSSGLRGPGALGVGAGLGVPYGGSIRFTPT